MEMTESKFRRWKIVIHNVDEYCQGKVNQHFLGKKHTKVISSVEPYDDTPGYHLHIYIQYKNRRYFQPLLKELKDLSSKVRCTKHLPDEGDIGRVQLDQWKVGETWAQKVQYLTNPVKDKKIGIACLNICKCICNLNKGKPHAVQDGCLENDDPRLKNKISRPDTCPEDLEI